MTDAPRPSAGCALANPEAPALTSMSVRYSLPSTFDGATPLPMILMLHATNQISDDRNVTTDARVAERYVIAAPQIRESLGTFESIMPTDFAAFFEELRTKLCFDERRFFAIGNGSGGRFLMRWLSMRSNASVSLEPHMRAVAVVGTYTGRYSWLPLPTLFVHGQNSRNSASVASDADGLKALAVFSGRNACGESSTPFAQASCTAHPEVNPGCVDYEGCTAPLRFCQHDDPSQSGTGDLWPCFGTDAIYQFFEAELGAR
jgi:hypothetical protein